MIPFLSSGVLELLVTLQFSQRKYFATGHQSEPHLCMYCYHEPHLSMSPHPSVVSYPVALVAFN